MNTIQDLICRDDEEWHKYRQPMNTFMLRDFKWMNGLIETTCDDFVKKIKRTTNAEAHLPIDTLHTELYMWSFYSNLMILSQSQPTSELFDVGSYCYTTRFASSFQS